MGLGSLTEGQFTRGNTCPLTAPTLQSPGQEAGPVAAGADCLAGAPNLCAAPRRPLPQRPALPPTWRSARRGEGAAVCSHSPGPRGRDCTPTFPHSPHPHSGARLPHPGAPSPLLASRGCPPSVDSFPRPGSPGFQTGVRPSHPMTPPTFPPPGIAVTGRQRPSPALLLRSRARGLQRPVFQSRVSPYPDSSPSPWGTQSCSTERS